jgi:tetratricopeptide (TPR) repeat protein
MPKARAAALKALQLNNTLAEGHAALAMVAEFYDYDWQTAEKELRRAVELDPNYATAHQWLSVHFSVIGRFDEALAEVERARQLDPLSLTIASNHAAVMLQLGQYERALAECHDVLDMDPGFTGCWDTTRDAYINESRFQEALDYVHKYIQPRYPSDAYLDEMRIYSAWGRRSETEQALARLKDAVKNSPSELDLPTNRIQIYMALGQQDQAIALLQRAYSEHSHLMTELIQDSVYDPLRGDPRFQDLLRRLRLAR